MSSAPVPWLRHWWSLGGAPRAFVQRDERLTRVCERLLSQGDPAAVMDKGDAYATLVASVELNRLLPADVDRPDDGVDALGDAPLGRRRPERAGSSERAGKRPERVRTTSADLARVAGAQPFAPNERSSSRARPEVEEAPSRSARSPAEVRELALRPLRSAVGAPAGDVAPRPATDLPTWMSRAVPVVGRELQPEVVAGVEHMLREASPAGNNRPAQRRGATTRESAASAQAPAQSSGTGGKIADRLAQVVRRVEQRLVERTAGAPPSSVADDRRIFGDVAAPPRRSDNGATPSWPSPPTRRAGAGERPLAQPPATGLRGLVERASFLGVRDASATDALWPDSELDRLSSLIDAGARIDGVPLEEGVS